MTGTICLVEFILLAKRHDPTWNSNGLLIWTIVEPGVYLIAATPPFMRPLLRRASQEVKASSLYRTMHGRSRTQFLRPAKTSENPSAGHERSGATELLEKEKLKSSSFASSIEADELEHPSKAYVYDPRQSECDTHRACIGTGIP